MEVEEKLNHVYQSKEDNFKKNKELNELNELPKEDIYSTLAKIPVYNIIIQNNKKNNENNKIVVYNNSIQRLLKLAGIDESDIFSFILFYHNEINLEAIDENKSLYNINYNELMNMIKYFHIRHNNNDIKIHKSSLKKIIDLCGLIRDEQFMYMNFNSHRENSEDSMDYKNSSNEKNSSSSNYNEDKNRIIRPTKIITNKNFKKAFDLLNDKENNYINEIEENKNLISNNRYKNKNYILDSDEEDYENNLLERSYKILRAKNINNMNQINNAYFDTKDDTYLTTLDSLSNENTINISLNENKAPKASKTKIKKIQKKKNKIKKKLSSFYEISPISSFSFIGSTTSLKKFYKDMETESDLIYPYNGYTKLNTSLSIETLNKERENQNLKIDDDYCFYPFIMRKTPELKDKTLYLTGSIPKLGTWDPLRAIKMDEEERNGEKFFTKYIEVYKKEIPFEYKYFYYDKDKIIWMGKPFENYIAFPQFFEYLRSLKKNHISIMNLNIRYINNIDGINVWKNRKNKLIELLLNKCSDVFFFQEMTKPQSTFIVRYLSSIYEFVGDYRDLTISSEKCSICVNKLKYTIIHSGQFWLSSTPDIPGSNDFGNFFPRTCTWASFKQIDGITLLFMNVHLDHANKRAHLPCIKILLQEEEKLESKYPDIKFIFIGGCFYCEENDEEIKYIKKKGYTEINFENTYHGFTGKAKNHWDYMFWKEKSGVDIELKDAHVLKKEATIDQYKNHYISDHFPVYAEFFHKNKK